MHPAWAPRSNWDLRGINLPTPVLDIDYLVSETKEEKTKVICSTIVQNTAVELTVGNLKGII